MFRAIDAPQTGHTQLPVLHAVIQQGLLGMELVVQIFEMLALDTVRGEDAQILIGREDVHDLEDRGQLLVGQLRVVGVGAKRRIGIAEEAAHVAVRSFDPGADGDLRVRPLNGLEFLQNRAGLIAGAVQVGRGVVGHAGAMADADAAVYEGVGDGPVSALVLAGDELGVDHAVHIHLMKQRQRVLVAGHHVAGDDFAVDVIPESGIHVHEASP